MKSWAAQVSGFRLVPRGPWWGTSLINISQYEVEKAVRVHPEHMDELHVSFHTRLRRPEASEDL